MKSIGDSLKNFKIPIPIEVEIEGIIEKFIFDNKNKKVKVKIYIQKEDVFIKSDAYTKRDIILNQKNIISIIKERFPKSKIQKFK